LSRHQPLLVAFAGSHIMRVRRARAAYKGKRHQFRNPQARGVDTSSQAIQPHREKPMRREVFGETSISVFAWPTVGRRPAIDSTLGQARPRFGACQVAPRIVACGGAAEQKTKQMRIADSRLATLDDLKPRAIEIAEIISQRLVSASAQFCPLRARKSVTVRRSWR